MTEVIIAPEDSKSDNSFSVIATLDKDKKGVGYGSAYVFLNQLEIKNILVDKNSRKLGVGKAILEELEKWGISRGAETAYAELVPAWCTPEELERFFEHQGYVIRCGFAEKQLKRS